MANELVQREQNYWCAEYADLHCADEYRWVYSKYLVGTDRGYTKGDTEYKAGYDKAHYAFVAPASPDIMKVFKFRIAFQIDWQWTGNPDVLYFDSAYMVEGDPTVHIIGSSHVFLGIKDDWNKWVEDTKWYDSYPPVEMCMSGLFVSDKTRYTAFGIRTKLGEGGPGLKGKVISIKNNLITQLSDASYPA